VSELLLPALLAPERAAIFSRCKRGKVLEVESLTAIQKAHGLAEDEFWPPEERSADYEAALNDYRDAWDQLFLDRLKADGEHELAELFRTERSGEFERQQEAGRQFFFGEPAASKTEVEAWLDALMDDVGDCITANDVMGPLGCRYGVEDDFVDVTVYPTLTELVGGAVDGEIMEPDFSLDLNQLRTIFDQVNDFGWQALGKNDPDGPHIWVEGIYRGREMYLRVLAVAPEDEEPGSKFDVNEKKWR
jgi:hypothetical protein